MEMPNYLDYDKMNAMDPWANNQAMAQVDLARQFQQSKLQEQQENVKKVGLANLYDEQNNPTRLQQGVATLDQTNIANRTNGVAARLAEQTEPDAKQAKINDYIMKAGRHEIDMLFQNAERAATSLDPEVKRQANEFLQRSKDALAKKQAHLYDMEKENAGIAGHERVANIQAAASRYGVDSRERQAAARQQVVGGLEQEIAKQRGNYIGMQDIYNRYAEIARKKGDIELARELIDAGQQAVILGERKERLRAAQTQEGNVVLNPNGGLEQKGGLGAPPIPAVAGRINGNAPPSTAPTSGGPPGWALHTDANGNKAWVSPDKKQFKEVN